MKRRPIALWQSLICLLLCVSMLAGTTFAWFTDRVTTGVNTIAAGNLDVELYHSNATVQNEQVKTDTILFKDLNGNPILWEPGVVSYENLRVTNEGDLALQYRLAMETANENFVVYPDGTLCGLSQILKVGVVEGGITATDRADVVAAVDAANWTSLANFLRTGNLLPAGKGESEKTWGVVVYWQPGDNDNLWNLNNGKQLDTGSVLSIDLGVKLVATQLTDESDSFGPDYDQNATFPGVTGGSVSTQVPVENNIVTADTTLQGNGFKAFVPAGTKLADGATQLTFSVFEKDSSEANLTLDDQEEMYPLDVHIEGTAPDNDKPILVTIEKAMTIGLNIGNYKLYHVENGVANQMTAVAPAELDAHNEFTYDPATGDITLAMQTFSEVAMVAEEAKWKGEFDYSWYTNAVAPVDGEAVEEYIIANADQLAAFGAIVGGMAYDENGNEIAQNNFKNQTVKLIADIKLGDREDASANLFYPIGYYNDAKSYAKPTDGTKTAANVTSFSGTFDGNGHTISDFYQNTWQMWGNYDGNNYKAAMGLFGYVNGGIVKNLTVDNFSSDGEFTPTGVIAAYANNSSFENIAITNCNPRVYNTGNGGIIGIAGRENAAEEHILLKNITVDNTNIISALWGSYDVACGGLVGMYRGNADSSGNHTGDTIRFENCHVSAQIDVYNDVCANYQYYAYRYAGMIIGSIRHNTKSDDGKTIPNMAGISAKGCTVNYGTWNNYYYCEFEKNGHPSYSGPDDYKFSRIPHSEINFTDSNGNGIIDTETEIASVAGCKHEHTDKENEENRCVYLPFKDQLFTGYSWGVSSIGIKEFEGFLNEKDIITEGEQQESVDKFVPVTSGDGNEPITFSNGKKVRLGDIFKAKENLARNSVNVGIASDKVQVFVSPVDPAYPVTAEYEPNTEDWTEGTLTFSGTGVANVTITDYYFCNPATATVKIEERKEEEKFDSKFTNASFTYRVGNRNAVKLSSLFAAKDGVTIGNVEVTVKTVDNTGASGTYTSNATWTNGTIQFSGTGIVKVTITDNDYCTPAELTLEVVDAVNATTATSATANNVVLLNDCGFSSLEVSGGYALYGNGFTMTCGSDSAALNTGYEFVALNNGTLDNVQIVCPNFDYAVLYSSNMTESGNRSETTDRTRYFNVKSAVEANGNSQILNSRISGGRAAVNVVGGNVVIDNSRIELGAVASILVGAANNLTLRDVTLVQKPTNSTYDSSKTLMGFSVLSICDANGDSAPITLEGKLVQNAWVNEKDKNYVPSAGQSIVSTVLRQNDYLHDIDGDGKNESLNLGIAYMPESTTSKVNATTITDNRTNKDSVPYDYVELSILNGKTYVYSYKNTNGTGDSFKDETDYEPNKYSDNIVVTYSDTADGLTHSSSLGTDGRWVYELNVDLDKLPGYKLDFSKISMSINGVSVTDFKVNGNAKPSAVAVTAGGTTYTLTATINGKEYTATYKVTGTETSKESPSLVGTPSYATGFGVANSYNGDWSAAVSVLDGITIKYWSVADKEYKEFALSSITFANTGKQNGSNSYWEYTHTNNDFTLKLTNTVAMHDKSQTFGIPVAGKDGKLYFTIASTGGFVGNGTSSRSITIKYEFTDNNGGETLVFTHKWDIAQDETNQYNYNSFVKDGTLTKLEDSSCVTGDTMITLADGTQKQIQHVTYGDQLLVWDFYTGAYTNVPASIIWNHGEANYDVTSLYFDDGTVVEMINSHGFFDVSCNNFVYITTDDVADYIGHSFVKVNGDSYTTVKLVDFSVENRYTGCYSLQTAVHNNFMVEGMFSMTTPDYEGWFDYFNINDDMKYDEEHMHQEIAKYGFTSYDTVSYLGSYDLYVALNARYLNMLIGRGVVTMDQVIEMLQKVS